MRFIVHAVSDFSFRSIRGRYRNDFVHFCGVCCLLKGEACFLLALVDGLALFVDSELGRIVVLAEEAYEVVVIVVHEAERGRCRELQCGFVLRQCGRLIRTRGVEGAGRHVCHLDVLALVCVVVSVELGEGDRLGLNGIVRGSDTAEVNAGDFAQAVVERGRTAHLPRVTLASQEAMAFGEVELDSVIGILQIDVSAIDIGNGGIGQCGLEVNLTSDHRLDAANRVGPYGEGIGGFASVVRFIFCGSSGDGGSAEAASQRNHARAFIDSGHACIATSIGYTSSRTRQRGRIKRVIVNFKCGGRAEGEFAVGLGGYCGGVVGVGSFADKFV